MQKRLWEALGKGRVMNLERTCRAAKEGPPWGAVSPAQSWACRTGCTPVGLESTIPESQADRRAGEGEARALSGRPCEAETEMHGASNSQGSAEALRKETPPFSVCSLCAKSCLEPKGLREGSVGLPCSPVCPRPQTSPWHRAETRGLLPDRQQGGMSVPADHVPCPRPAHGLSHPVITPVQWG